MRFSLGHRTSSSTSLTSSLTEKLLNSALITYLVNIPPKELYFLYHFCSLCTNRMTRIKNIAVPDDLVFFLSIVNTITGALPACAVPMMHFSNNTAGATGWLRDEKRAELV